MSKLYRSLLWSGLVAAGVAACGDDVTVAPPPPPPTPGVHSIAVAPNGVTVAVGSATQMQAAVNADAGVATTVTWTINAPASVATITSGGLLTAVGVGAVAVQACSTVNTAVCGNATITIASTAAAVTQVNVTPPTAFLVRPATGSVTLQLTAAVIGTNSPSQTVSWSLPGAPANASISASGVLTVLAAIVAPATLNVSACSTVSGFTNVCGFAAVTIQVPTPATVSIASVTWTPAPPGSCVPGPGPAVAVVLTNVRCQIEVTANVNAGDAVLSRLDVLIGGQVVASEPFPGTVASNDGNASVSAPVQITLSVNTQQLRRPTGSTTLFVPVIFNGNQGISLNLYTATSATPLASVATPVVMNNPDAALKVGAAFTLVNNSSSPSFTNITGTWFTGTQTGGSIQYASFSTVVPSALSFTATTCGASTSNNITGTAATGITIGANWTCAGVEGGNSITGVTLPATYPTLVGPDGTTAVPATSFSTVGSAFSLPTGATTTESRWNMINPTTAPTASNTVLVDNKAPTVTIGTIAYNASYDQKWVNGSYNLSGQVTVVDGGTGPNAAATATRFWNFTIPASCSGAAITSATASTLAETLTSAGFDAYTICGVGADNIGNTAVSGPSNSFGVDKTAPLARLAGSTAATPSIAPSNTSTISTTPNTTIYATAAQINSQVFGLEGFDTRSGFNQNVVSGSDAATQTLTRTLQSGVTGCSVNDQLTVVLSDSWIRMPTLTLIDCGSGLAGYYDYSGNVNDRAGNFSSPNIVRNFAYDLSAPVTSFVSPAQTTYTPGSTAAFNVIASDDLEVLKSYLSFSFTGLGPPATGIIYPYGSFAGLTIGSPWPSSPPISATVPSTGTSGTISIPYLLGRIDESCTAAGVPYPSCGATVGSKPTSGSDYNRDLNLNAPSSGNSAQAPTGIVTNVQDIALRDGLTGAAFSFNPVTFVTPVSQQWSGATDVNTWIGKNGTGDCPASTICADQKTGTSNGLQFFTTVSLWRLNTATNQWTYCGDLVPQGPPPFVDNGVYRIWRSTTATPGGSTTCGVLTGFYRVMGTLNGAGLFSPSF